MAHRSTRILIGLGIAAIAAWMLAGCGGSTSGTGTLQVSLMDAPFNAEEINIVISSVQAHKTGGEWYTVEEYDPPLEVNLLDFESPNPPLLLAEAPLAAGHYTMIRLMLESAEIVKGGTPLSG